jgi:hypothetical protein
VRDEKPENFLPGRKAGADDRPDICRGYFEYAKRRVFVLFHAFPALFKIYTNNYESAAAYISKTPAPSAKKAKTNPAGPICPAGCVKTKLFMYGCF